VSNVIPFPAHGRDGPDPELGDGIVAAVTAVERQPTDARALRRLVRLLAPGISEFHEQHGALSVIFARIREGAPLEDEEIRSLLVTARAEARFLITGAV
jgi:hypothetical protein